MAKPEIPFKDGNEKMLIKNRGKDV